MPLNLLHIGITLLIALLPMSRYPETQKVRKPAVAGSFYPTSAKEIKSMIGPWMHPADGSQAPQALIVPHAGYVFSGEVAASAFSRIPRGHAYKRIFLLGPSHRVGFAGASVDTLYAFAETPLGKVPVDNALAKGLIHKGDGAFTFRLNRHVYIFPCLRILRREGDRGFRGGGGTGQHQQQNCQAEEEFPKSVHLQ